MAKFKFTTLVDVNGNDIVSAKFADAGIVDADIGKPVKLSSTNPDQYALCADGDQIDGFISSVEPATIDGKVFGTVQTGGRVRVEASGASTMGAVVEAGAVSAAGTAETNGLALVSTHTPDITSVTTLRDTTFPINWRIISCTLDSGTGVVETGDTSVIIERL